MQYDDFIGHVQHRARVAAPDDAVKATRCTLGVLSDRLPAGSLDNLAAQLPDEIARFVKTDRQGTERFGVKEFFHRVAAAENVDEPLAAQHTRAVLATVRDAVSAGEFDKLEDQLPDDWQALLESGSEGAFESR